MKFFLTILILATALPSLGQITYEIDGSAVRFSNVEVMVYHDADGNEITEEEKRIFLDNNDRYSNVLRVRGGIPL